MEVITIETKTFRHLISRIENMEQMMLSLTKIVKQENNKPDGYPEFITRQEAMAEFKISKTTVDFKVRKYNVQRQPSGGKKLIHRQEFIKALRQKEVFNKVINTKK